MASTIDRCAQLQLKLLKVYLTSTNKNDKISTDHPKLAGFEDSLSIIRKRRHDEIWSTSSFKLPFKVQSKILSDEVIEFSAWFTKILLLDFLSDDEGVQENKKKVRKV